MRHKAKSKPSRIQYSKIPHPQQFPNSETPPTTTGPPIKPSSLPRKEKKMEDHSNDTRSAAEQSTEPLLARKSLRRIIIGLSIAKTTATIARLRDDCTCAQARVESTASRRTIRIRGTQSRNELLALLVTRFCRVVEFARSVSG